MPMACIPKQSETPAFTAPAAEVVSTKITNELTLYSDETLKLTYPSSWKTIDEVFNRPPSKRTNKEFKADVLLTATNAIPDSYGSKYTAWCDLMYRPVLPGESREEMVSSSYSVLNNYTQIDSSQQELKMLGMDALEKIYRRPRGEPWYKVRDVWFFHPEKTIILSCYAHPDDFADNLRTFQQILDSIQFR